METQLEKIKLNFEKDILPLIPTRCTLHYVDYNENLDDQSDTLQQCLSDGSLEALDNMVWEWYHDAYSGMDYILKELKEDIEREFDLEDGQDILDEFEDEIRDTIYDRDDSNVVKDLLKNTGNLAMFYDTGYEMESDSWSWTDAEVKRERQRIKKHLGIPAKVNTWDNTLDLTIRQASYGGNVEIYFSDGIEDFIDTDGVAKIQFSNFQLGIINHGNGSGDMCELDGCVATLPFNRANIFLDKTVSYNWTYDIAGMCGDAYDRTGVKFIYGKKPKKQVESSSINDHNAKEKELDAIYTSGKCTFGDMKYTRHRTTEYINNFPCGTKCKDCGTFWID